MAHEDWTHYNGTNALDLLSERGSSQINKLPVGMKSATHSENNRVHLFHLFSLSSFLSTSVWDQACHPRGIGRVFNRQEEEDRLENGPAC
jgi:hypothetical protein